MSDFDDATVVVRREGRIGRLTLNRPKALNALDLGMIRVIAGALEDWRDDPGVHLVVLDAAGERAFCAGGDVREIRRLSLAGAYGEIERFFVEEYALNLVIARYPKPYVSLIDGICMGGGIGLSVHGGIRVASEGASFAMPETIIGLFPDVGATFVLPRLRGVQGMWLALTGARVGGAEAVWAGLATHYVTRERMGGLAAALAADGVSALAPACSAVGEVAVPGGMGAFGADSVAGIVAALEAEGSEWAGEQLAALRQVSPSSLLWTFEIVRAGARRTFEQCQAAELGLTRLAVRHPDFLEGVRAMLVDKDRAPRWSLGRIEDVDPRVIAAMFS